MNYPKLKDNIFETHGVFEILTDHCKYDLNEYICGYLNCAGMECVECAVFTASDEDILNEYSDVLIEYKLKKLEL